jgi:hypothetical protein
MVDSLIRSRVKPKAVNGVFTDKYSEVLLNDEHAWNVVAGRWRHWIVFERFGSCSVLADQRHIKN